MGGRPDFPPSAGQASRPVYLFLKKNRKPKFPGFPYILGGRPDSNRRPPEPQSGVLTN